MIGLETQASFVGEDGLSQFALLKACVAEVVVELCAALTGEGLVLQVVLKTLFVEGCRLGVVAFAVKRIGFGEGGEKSKYKGKHKLAIRN